MANNRYANPELKRVSTDFIRCQSGSRDLLMLEHEK